MKIHIVGSEGYIGRALVRELDSVPGTTVTTADALLYGQSCPPRTKHLVNSGEHIRYVNEVDPDVVVLLAATAHDPAGRLSEFAVRGHTFYTPHLIALDAFDRGRRVVVVSSLAVNAQSGHYPLAKHDLERYLGNTLAFAGRGSIIRFGTIFGVAGPRPDAESFRSHLLLNNMLYTALDTGRITVHRPALRRPVLTLDRAVQTLKSAIFSVGPYGTITNHWTTSGQLRDYAESVRRFLDGVGVPAVVEELDQAGDTRDYGWGWYDDLRLREDLFETLGFIRENMDEIRRVRETSWEELYKRA